MPYAVVSLGTWSVEPGNAVGVEKAFADGSGRMQAGSLGIRHARQRQKSFYKVEFRSKEVLRHPDEIIPVHLRKENFIILETKAKMWSGKTRAQKSMIWATAYWIFHGTPKAIPLGAK